MGILAKEACKLVIRPPLLPITWDQKMVPHKEVSNSIQHSYNLKDENYHCLSNDATIMVSLYKFPIIG